ncbi:MAG: thioredoxin domain-containing protein, partial [Candidatus Binataceae bacterium]
HCIEMVRHTLKKMAMGGIYDHLGGGFHRYSVDERWLVPHFEKMLYDNALLARLYFDAGRAMGEPAFLAVGGEILEYVLREMTSPDGGFYSTQDADSEGEEGKFFVWTPEEVEEVLGGELARIAERHFDISPEGNFEGKNILHLTLEPGVAARLFNMSEGDMQSAIKMTKRKLFEARERRVKPGRDEKILAAWNGMMISAFAEGARTLHEPRYLAAAERCAEFMMTRLWDGRALRRSLKDGVARFNAYLEDYALMANAMLDVYQASLEPRYLAYARTLADVMLERFLDREKGGFFFTSDDHEVLITRSKAAFDGSTPSGNSSAVMALLRLGAYTGEEKYSVEAERTLKLFRDLIEKQPFGFSHMLEAADLYLNGPTEVVLVGGRDSAEIREWLERLGLVYVPNLALFVADPTLGGQSYLPAHVRDRAQVDARATAYVCRERVCSVPLASFKELEAELTD